MEGMHGLQKVEQGHEKGSLPSSDQMLDRLADHEYYYLLDGYSGYNQICIALEDQEKTTFTCPFGTFAFHRVLFGICGAPATFSEMYDGYIL